ncbi:polymeric immunoglobulin receptor-like isoform X3 [Melanotaenia boesemani]|uniref:polymeric immunoglobulin receptor-like isoform X3 n=1 Tax=Melanotaenia boesemani TaxID=1250792 RepID=UPI001C046BDD|nr:polymeric immunoglobulin receptor-like isoform X3 [Melanotaenia boesemani]
MWSFQNFFFILGIFFLSYFPASLSCVSSGAGVIHVFGYEGRDVKIPCEYGDGYEDYEKYLCKDDCGHSDILITTTQTNKTKYFIYEDRKTRIFTVTISDLSAVDAGKYWCGVSRNGKDIYTEVQLDVRQDICCDEVNKIQSHEEASVSISCPYESQDKNNLKYLCRGKQPSTCLQQAVITSNSTQNRRFRLTDDKTTRFTVNIASLTLEDSGLYLCGVHRNTGLDVFTAVELKVKEWCCLKSKNMSGIVGRAVTLQCPYPPQHQNNRKFLCKGDKHNSCTDMTNQSRFTLHNVSSHSFLVTIKDLEAGDAGTYWCGSDAQWSVGNYTKIYLSVEYQQETITVEIFSINSSHVPGKPFEDAGLNVVLPVSAVLLLIMASVLVIVYKRKCSKDRGDRSKPKTVDTQGVVDSEDLNEIHDAVVKMKRYHPDDTDEDQPDYKDVSSEQIYNNEF